MKFIRPSPCSLKPRLGQNSRCKISKRAQQLYGTISKQEFDRCEVELRRSKGEC